MNIEEIAKKNYPDIEGYLDQVEHDRKNFIKGYNYAKTNNMKEPEQYVNDLIKKYSRIDTITRKIARQCAIIDVNNTIDAVENLSEKYYYIEVLTILESKL